MLLLAFHFVSGIGFAIMFPATLVLFTGRADGKAASGTMSLFYLQCLIGSTAAGFLASQFDQVSARDFWLMHAAMFAGVAVCLALVGSG